VARYLAGGDVYGRSVRQITDESGAGGRETRPNVA
jgi:hypothetical protein